MLTRRLAKPGAVLRRAERAYLPSTRRFARFTTIPRTFLFCKALMANLPADLLLSSFMAIAFFTICLSSLYALTRLL